MKEGHKRTTTTNAIGDASRPTAIRNPYATGRIAVGVQKYVNANVTLSNNKGDDDSNRANDTKYPSDMTALGTTETAPSVSNHRKPRQSNELAYWERLPSRNVSFSPAEILTVRECLKTIVAKLYCDEGRSIRVTGILEHRCIGADDCIEIQLRDPMSTSAAEISKAKRRKSGGRRSLSGNKRPWFVAKEAPKSTLTVIADTGPNLSAAIVGSCVTILGEFREKNGRYHLEARTLAVASHCSDTKLYEEALGLRRRSMYERYYYDTQRSSQTLLQGCGPPPYDTLAHRC